MPAGVGLSTAAVTVSPSSLTDGGFSMAVKGSVLSSLPQAIEICPSPTGSSKRSTISEGGSLSSSPSAGSVSTGVCAPAGSTDATENRESTAIPPRTPANTSRSVRPGTGVRQDTNRTR